MMRAIVICLLFVSPALGDEDLPEHTASVIGEVELTVAKKPWHATLTRRVLDDDPDKGGEVDELKLVLKGPAGKTVSEKLKGGVAVTRERAEPWKPFLSVKHIGPDDFLFLRLPAVGVDTFVTSRLYRVAANGRLTLVLDVVKATEWGGAPCFVESSFDLRPDGDDGSRVVFVAETRRRAAEGKQCSREGTKESTVRFEWKRGCFARAPEDGKGIDHDLNLKWERECVPGVGRR
jgi:hypothetical protein